MKIIRFSGDEMANVLGVAGGGEVRALEVDNPHLGYVVDLLGITWERLDKGEPSSRCANWGEGPSGPASDGRDGNGREGRGL